MDAAPLPEAGAAALAPTALREMLATMADPQGVLPPWTREDNAYLAFGATYAAELAFAREQSWPAERLDGSHLHHLHQPDLVADRILDLARRLG